jgi:hypothetical protein
MLDVEKKMLGCSTGAGFRDDDVAAELRRQFEQSGAGSHGYACDPDSDAGLRAGSVNRSRMHASDYGSNSTQYERFRVFRPRRIQLQRSQHLPEYLRFGDLVR